MSYLTIDMKQDDAGTSNRFEHSKYKKGLQEGMAKSRMDMFEYAIRLNGERRSNMRDGEKNTEIFQM